MINNKDLSNGMYIMWCFDMKKAILRSLDQLEQLNIDNRDEWLRFREEIRSQTYFAMRNTIDDERFIEVWNQKGDTLARLYRAVEIITTRFSPPVSMEELYREKYEQALDWLSNKATEIPPLLMVELPTDTLLPHLMDQKCDEVATKILKKRSEWIHKMAQIEMKRLRFKQEIFETDDVPLLLNMGDIIQTEFEELSNKWISTLI